MSEASGGGISQELRDGIAAYKHRIEQLGGYGTRVSATMPNGDVRTGALIELGSGGCQPGIQTDDGKRYAAGDLADLVVVAVEAQS